MISQSDLQNPRWWREVQKATARHNMPQFQRLAKRLVAAGPFARGALEIEGLQRRLTLYKRYGFSVVAEGFLSPKYEARVWASPQKALAYITDRFYYEVARGLLPVMEKITAERLSMTPETAVQRLVKAQVQMAYSLWPMLITAYLPQDKTSDERRHKILNAYARDRIDAIRLPIKTERAIRGIYGSVKEALDDDLIGTVSILLSEYGDNPYALYKLASRSLNALSATEEGRVDDQRFPSNDALAHMADTSDGDNDGSALPGEPEPTPDQQLLAKEMARESTRNFEEWTAKLSPKEREVVRLRADNLSYEEIAERMGCDAREVGTYSSRARKKLNAIRYST